ncbi:MULTISPECIES: hypothetical protein [unclassified Luteimonas]
MDWRLSALLYAVTVIVGYGNGAPYTASRADEPTRVQVGVHAIRQDFPFPVMPGWIEHSTTQAEGPPRRVLSSTWIHDGDAASQAIAYRHVLEAAGYRVAPGRLAPNTEIALTGTGMVAGWPYRFAVDFSRGPGGDPSVVLVFTPCASVC